MRWPCLLPIAAMTLMMTGCATYEYDLVSPPNLAGHIGPKRDDVIRAEPIEYRMRSYESRLVIEVFNPTHDPITLVGDRSYVVAPDDQSHPFRSQTIGPEAYVRLILPPMRPYYRSSGPTIGFGFGFSRGYYGPRYSRFGADYYYDEPRYFTYVDESDTTYWNWEGETDVRIHLVYQTPKGPVTDDFTFHRKKM